MLDVVVCPAQSTYVPPSHIQCAVASDAGLVAIPAEDDPLQTCVWKGRDLCARLGGHESKVTAMCFATVNRQTKLLTASDDAILLWSLESEARECDRLQIVDLGDSATDDARINQITADTTRSCACMGLNMVVHDLQTTVVSAWLQGHTGDVVAAEFSPHSDNLLVSISEDRSFIVWDLQAGALLHRSCIESSTSFTSLSIDPGYRRFAVGSAGGVVKLFSLETYKCLHVVDYRGDLVKKSTQMKMKQATHDVDQTTTTTTMPKVIGPRGSNNLAANVLTTLTDNSRITTDTPADILQLCFGPPAPVKSQIVSESGFSDVLSSVLRHLVVGTSSSLGLLNLNTYKIDNVISLSDAFSTCDISPNATISVASGFSMDRFTLSNHQNDVDVKFSCVMTAAFDRRVACATITIKQGVSSMSDNNPSTKQISMLAMDPLVEKSPLHASMNLVAKPPQKNATNATAKGTSRGTKLKKGDVKDSPVTFGRKIKSSGYGGAPPSQKMFHPKTDFGKKKSNDQKLPPIDFTKRRVMPKTSEDAILEYPVDCDPPTKLIKTVSLSSDKIASSPIVSVNVSASGRSIAAVQSNKLVNVLRLPACEEKDLRRCCCWRCYW